MRLPGKLQRPILGVPDTDLLVLTRSSKQRTVLVELHATIIITDIFNLGILRIGFDQFTGARNDMSDKFVSKAT